VSLSIDKAYLLVTTRCNDACPYCIIRKTDEEMTSTTAVEGLRLVFSTPGENKQVALYGGEPLLHFSLASVVVDEVRRLQEETGKRGALYVYTNGLALDDEKLAYLAANHFALLFSLDAAAVLSTRKRLSERHQQTFPRKLANLQRALATLGRERVCGAAVVLPEDVAHLVAIVRYLVDDLELQVIKLLPGLGRYHWTDAELAQLERQLANVRVLLEQRRRAGRPFYVDLLDESLARAPAGAKGVSVVEIYPNGKVGLSPCEFELPAGLAHLNDTDRYVLGTVGELGAGDFAAAMRRFDHELRHRGLRLLSVWSETLACELAARAETDEGVRHYVRCARELTFA
jgi:sulfatase maturation enzyme AslB (radical SAM superfamily)